MGRNDGDVRMVPKLKNRTVLILLLVAKLCESLPILGDFKAKLHFPQSHFPFQSFIYFFLLHIHSPALGHTSCSVNEVWKIIFFWIVFLFGEISSLLLLF